MTHTDVLISGAGIAGLVAAAGLAAKGLTVTIVDPSPPVQTAEADGSDLRSTAFLQPSRVLFDKLGLWDVLSAHATPLRALQVIDSTGWPPVETDRRVFKPADLEEDVFGWNLPNWRTRATLADDLAETPGITLRLGVGFAGMLARDDEVRADLSDGSRITARLVVGADGRASSVARAAGITMKTRRYGQKVLAFVATHTAPHHDVSTEIYNSGGAFTTVPLPDHEGAPASAIVWMNGGARALELYGLNDADFGAEMTLRACHILGDMRPISPRRMWPVVTQTAQALTARRTALIAEAAHVLPPIGAQGLNTSLHDVSALLDALSPDPGAPEGLRIYETARAKDISGRAAVIDLFNRVCKSDAAPVQALRLAGLRQVHDIAPIRRTIMRAGLGPLNQNT
ncbi:FAD-dependent monooxygenase [Oceaniglobus ichthyenteri]|uniref:FAD-dependent monooxygenase n=1 Tax=Oceaniglobus ichthyenteri TaxID=2136177 RepID=UPI000D38F96B|nr:FAD-dependent monooxygenase [Oceaniglobus ichthyenteri]